MGARSVCKKVLKSAVITITTLLAAYIVLVVIRLPICLKFNPTLEAYTNYFGIPVISRVFDITRKMDGALNPYLKILYGEAFFEGKATVIVAPYNSDAVSAACINNMGDIIDVTNCRNTNYDAAISEILNNRPY